MFAVGAMTPEQKEGMSHQLDEFVLKCSFNQKDCDMQQYVVFLLIVFLSNTLLISASIWNDCGRKAKFSKYVGSG